MNNKSDLVAIEFISVLGMPPVPFIDLAAELGVRHIGMALTKILQENPHDYPAWSLRDDPALRRETIAALKATGVSISVGEGFLAWPDKDLADYAADLDLMAELGASRINMLSLDSDLACTSDQCAKLAEMAGARGLQAVIEYMPGLAVGHLDTALQLVRHSGQKNFGVMIDTMHFFRSGSKPEDLATVDPALIGYIQLCDVPAVSKYGADYAYEAQYDRQAPGYGELPLAAFLAAAPKNLLVGLEIPQLAEAISGLDAKARLAPAIAITREMLAAAAK